MEFIKRKAMVVPKAAAGLPLGLHLIDRAFDEETLLCVAGVLEASAGFDAEPAFLAR